VLANVAVAAVTALVLGAPGDIGAVVRAGGNVHAAVDAGEVWRIATSVFVHVGWVHLLVNMVGLWSIGRMLEGIFGPARTFAIYACAGLAGATASHLFGAAGVSAGASGAIFGLLGALVVELLVAGKRYPRPGRNALVGALVFVALVQLFMGLLYAAIDQWNHGVGLAAGALAGLLLSPHGPAARVRGWLARAIAIAGLAVFAVAGALAATTSYADTLAREGTAERAVGGVAITLPAPWQPADDGYADDPDRLGFLYLARTPAPLPAAFEQLQQAARARAKQVGFEDAVAVPDDERLIALPAGWRSWELVATLEDDLGATQRFRTIVFAHADPIATVTGILYVPEILAADARDRLATWITSAHATKLAPPPARR
jgi:rhomboid protease GluP